MQPGKRHRQEQQRPVVRFRVFQAVRAQGFGQRIDQMIEESAPNGLGPLTTAHGEGMRFGSRFAETDVFIDAAGAPPALTEVIALAKYRARVAVIALYKKPVALDLFKLMANEIMMTGSIADSRARIRRSHRHDRRD